MAELYDTIQMLCQQRGIKAGFLCKELGISRGLLTDLKMGRKKGVNAQTAQKIADYFGVSVGYLLGSEACRTVRDVLEEVDVAFYGAFKELTEEQKDAVRDMVQVMRKQAGEEDRV